VTSGWTRRTPDQQERKRASSRHECKGESHSGYRRSQRQHRRMAVPCSMPFTVALLQPSPARQNKPFEGFPSPPRTSVARRGGRCRRRCLSRTPACGARRRARRPGGPIMMVPVALGTASVTGTRVRWHWQPVRVPVGLRVASGSLSGKGRLALAGAAMEYNWSPVVPDRPRKFKFDSDRRGLQVPSR
jgi:hypothetical protein